MRTTLDIDEAVLSAVKELARRQGKTAGEVISELARRALMHAPSAALDRVRDGESLYGFRPLPEGDTPVTNELLDALRDQLGV